MLAGFLLLITAGVVTTVIHSGPTGTSALENHSPPQHGVVRRRLHSHGSFGTAHALFGLHMYGALSSAQFSGNGGGGNVAFSPLSVAAVLYALGEGANGTTASEIYGVLNRTLEVGRSDSHKLSAILGRVGRVSSSTVDLVVANRLFVQVGCDLLPEFTSRLASLYRMKSLSLDFENDPGGAEGTVNHWVAEATRQHITSLIPPGTLDGQTKLVLVNGIYFKGDWMTMFDLAKTRSRLFYAESSTGAVGVTHVPTMYLQADLPYRDFQRFKFEMVELAYASGSVSMFVILPYAESSLAQTTRHLLKRPGLLASPRHRLYNTTTTVLLPKFSLEESVDLKGVLLNLGMRQAFEQGKADLSGIDGTLELYVSDAFHKVAVEVDERGSTAAASSGLVIKGRSMSSDPVFRASRPFLFFIRHNPTSSILFLGHVKSLKDAMVGSLTDSREQDITT